MPAADRPGVFDLRARARELEAVICGARFTDAGGAAIDAELALARLHDLLAGARGTARSVYVVGNGGSAAVAAHTVTDFLKVGGLRAMALHDPSLLSCLANDYSYDQAFARAIEVLCRPDDIVIAISSSGRSPNMHKAAAAGRAAGGSVVTLSGFAPDNPLRALGDVNVWLDSRDYGMVEAGHQFVLHNLSDRLAPTR